MKRALLLAGLLFASPLALAQYNGPAVEACRDVARKELARNGASGDAVIEPDATLVLERYRRKLGTQFVSSILTGNGAVVNKDAPSVELSFICLLADDNRALLFQWLPALHVSPLAQCRRGEAMRKQARSCLDFLLRTAEAELGMAYAHRFQEANERGETALAAYRASNDEWRQYRDAECHRRQDLAPAGVPPEDYALACVVELTRRRALDMR